MKTDLSPHPSSDTRSPSALLLGVSALLLAALVLWRLSAYGIWDPWELSIADAARKLAEGAPVGDVVPLPVRLVGASFSAFGTREWAGRLPMALAGLLLLLVSGAWTALLTERRTGVYAALVLASTPFFLLHSREMVGATPTFLGAAVVMLGASGAVFGRARSSAQVYGLLALALLGGLLGAFSGGVLVGVLPPLAAVAVLSLLVRPPWKLVGAQRNAAAGVVAAALLITAAVARAVFRHAAEPTLWIGSAPVDGSVVTYERAVEHLFHGFAPWSALLPLALASVLRAIGGSPRESAVDAPESARERDATDPQAPLGALCLLWAALAYAAQSLYLSSFGQSAFAAPGALAAALALWLRQRERDERDDVPELIVGLLFLGLVFRDFALYPQSPFAALEIGEAKTPDIFNPKRAWGLVLGLFGMALLLTGMPGQRPQKLDLRAPYRGLAKLWRAGRGQRAWLAVFALSALGLLVFGGLAFAAPRLLQLTSLGARIGRVLLFVPLLVPLAVAAAQAVYQASQRLRPLRAVLPLAAALLVGAYTSQVFLPQLSAHLSPRSVFDTYNALAKAGEPLAQHRVEGRAAAYYAKGEVRDIAGQPELVDFLSAPGRRWVALPSEQLADVDVAFRRRSGRHLFVPALDNAKVILAASQALPGKPDLNPLARFVQTQLPAIQNPVHADFEGKLELLGYDLELPRGTSVGPGQSFHVTWIWRAKQSNLGAYQVFLHLDADNQRINGDHDPVDGKYPVRLWDQGDVIIDRQEIAVPATSPAGVYTLYVGLFRGESRLKVTEGPRDPSDRVKAGTVRVQ